MQNRLINAANLHVGGGVQVAASFIYELSKIIDKSDLISVVCSQAVYENIPQDMSCLNFISFEIYDLQGFSKPKGKDKILFSGYDVCFTVFGPVYFNLDARVHICGFAQPWIAYPKNDAYSLLPFKNVIVNKLKFLVQSVYFSKVDILIVEQDHVKLALESLGFKSCIEVVSNCVSSVFLAGSESKLLDKRKDSFTLGFIGRAYVHKNLGILKDVNAKLSSYGVDNVSFLFTLNQDEMNGLGFDEIINFHSVGEINSSDCPLFYNSIDALIFPSLLECFSASPIEAMFMKTPVLASNRDFVTDICKDNAIYFDPLSVDDIARSIINAINEPELLKKLSLEGYNEVKRLPKASERAKKYLELITTA